jgi:TonB family protein
MFADRVRVMSRTLPTLAVLVTLMPCLALASDPALPPASILTAPDLYGRLAGAERTEAFRLEGDYDRICDSLVLAGGSSLDCFVRTAEIRFKSEPYFSLLYRLILDCDWTPSALAWTSPAAPAIGFVIDTDSASVSLLLSLRAMKATLSSPGVGSVACVIPERLYREVLWCLWQIDPDHPEVAPAIRTELLRLGLDPDSEPEDVAMEEVVAEEVVEEEAPGEFSPPYPIVLPQPEYPAFAKVVGAHGVVVVRVLVGIDGRAKDMDIVHSVFGLDQAARWAVLQCTFHPARRGNRPVEAWTEVDVPFSLEEPK